MIAVKWDEAMYINIQVFDMIGRLEYQANNVNGGMRYIDTSTFHDGAYNLVINGEDSGRFIISH